MLDLKAIYLQALQACEPDRLVRHHVTPDLPRNVVAIGKCAAPLLEGVASRIDVARAFVAVPEGYREPRLDDSPMPSKRRHYTVARGGHPGMTAASFAAGRGLLRFIDECDDILFLISGGGSACVDSPLIPWFEEGDLSFTNARLIAAGLPIGEINIVRKHLSAIKGGRLAARTRGRSVSLIYSDVSPGALADVASGPTLPDPATKQDAIAVLSRVGGCERIIRVLASNAVPETVKQLESSRVELIADNTMLTSAAAEAARAAGARVRVLRQQIECDVHVAARLLADEAMLLGENDVLIAGGEPTVVVSGDGKGGRCTELAVRFALAAELASDASARFGFSKLHTLFGSSDGVDGSSGIAGVSLAALPAGMDVVDVERQLANSNSLAIAVRIGEPIIIPQAGNNLRDLFLLARG